MWAGAWPRLTTLLFSVGQLCVCVGNGGSGRGRLSALDPRKLCARLSFLMSCENGLSSPNLR